MADVSASLSHHIAPMKNAPMGAISLERVYNIVSVDLSDFNGLRDRVLEKPTNTAENLQFSGRFVFSIPRRFIQIIALFRATSKCIIQSKRDLRPSGSQISLFYYYISDQRRTNDLHLVYILIKGFDSIVVHCLEYISICIQCYVDVSMAEPVLEHDRGNTGLYAPCCKCVP